jgi:hypothetical protein
MRYCDYSWFKGDWKSFRWMAWKTDVQVLPATLVKRIAERKDLDSFRQDTAFVSVDK